VSASEYKPTIEIGELITQVAEETDICSDAPSSIGSTYKLDQSYLTQFKKLQQMEDDLKKTINSSEKLDALFAKLNNLDKLDSLFSKLNCMAFGGFISNPVENKTAAVLKNDIEKLQQMLNNPDLPKNQIVDINIQLEKLLNEYSITPEYITEITEKK